MILNHSAPDIMFEAGVENDHCNRCGNKDRTLFYTYYSEYHKRDITYCLFCITLGRSDSVTPLYGYPTVRARDNIDYRLEFELNEIQKSASARLTEAIKQRHNLMLYAVTGAGKTEITFEGIKYARRNGLNVAFVSPRIDVVKEVYLRLAEAFKGVRIDLMYSGVKSVFTNMFTVCTVHQLFNYKDHYDVIIIDEVDAFPLPEEPLLMETIQRAAAADGSIILMTATPAAPMKKMAGKDNIVTIARRYHGHDLAVPKVIFHNAEKYINKNRMPKKLESLLDTIVNNQRRVLVFFPDIKMMQRAKAVLENKYPRMESVYSGDAERFEKVQRMRDGELDILLTTTILERGVTFSYLDVIVVDAHRFDSAGLIQISGRVGRKPKDPTGNIWLLTVFNTTDIRRTIKVIRDFNRGRTAL
ncbi:ATP-dependent DNA helicase RecG [Jeotgalicoccus saudimassiliensis]|uniref:ATP-dependent DNA helicase RecG n=1 Tax=Jeotgalicoccus saudimassiliensis TaxID=1461582 RepID=A0A078M2H4_9STAP|nr:DEAD/DEAH box helicase family protein [Jeotgalicoccus saudimassiliensis]CDZ99061.1 ATP-dependent DNA helicase RecG [Jeotgalicoccus saudimassiliensis]